ncbi:MAG: thioredoxin-disulfide reductase [Caldimicrobium thiodismutans]|uniref:Thioredoxin reductase n=1 Tax=Caldimicrobium thiodismutans TaxID=1653476 RepID=A0A2N7PKV0_9BACT|nr:MAG: thioredoxin-disulfide reductase [Caldimicrobium thiodismutans]
MSEELFDLIIVGAGPAGLTACLYASRSLLKTLLLEKGPIGGQDLIENYPGFPGGISGYELIERIQKQLEDYEYQFLQEEVIDLQEVEEVKEVHLSSGKVLKAKAVILALGAKLRKLGVPGEREFTGRGVSYCAICDGPFFKGEEVAVIGGGNTALQEAIYLTKYVKKVYLIHRRETFRATSILQERVKKNPQIEIIVPSVIEEIKGSDKVEKIVYRNLKSNEKRELEVAGVFIFIGHEPETGWLKGKLEMDESGFIIVDREMRTSRPGIFACGDCVSKKFRQIINACGEGAVAALNAEEYIKNLEK